MKKRNFLGIFALTMLASSFVACTKTVYLPEPTYYDNMANSNRPANQGSEGFYFAGNKSNNNNYKAAPSLIDRVNNREYQRPDKPIADRVVMGPNHPTPPVYYNEYSDAPIVEEVLIDDVYNGQQLAQSPPNRPEARTQPAKPTPPPVQPQEYNYSNAPKVRPNKNTSNSLTSTQQYNYSNAPATTKKVNTPVVSNTQQYYYNTPEANSPVYNNAPAPKVNTVSTNNTTTVQKQQDLPFSQFFDQNVTISFKNGARLDGVISKHPNSISKVIIKLANGSTYEGAIKDIEKVEYKY